MSNFLERLAAITLGAAPTLAPLIHPLTAPANGPAVDTPQSEIAAERMAKAPHVSPMPISEPTVTPVTRTPSVSEAPPARKSESTPQNPMVAEFVPVPPPQPFQVHVEQESTQAPANPPRAPDTFSFERPVFVDAPPRPEQSPVLPPATSQASVELGAGEKKTTRPATETVPVMPQPAAVLPPLPAPREISVLRATSERTLSPSPSTTPLFHPAEQLAGVREPEPVRVVIDRIEVRAAVPPPVEPAQPRTRPAPALSLDDYLRNPNVRRP
jgi:hypothetical protein